MIRGMKRRYLYVLLFGVPALLVSVIISFLLFGAAAGVLWIFVFGDSPWPASAGKMLTAMFFVACLTLWIAFLSVAFIAGKRQEKTATLNLTHVMVSVGVTAFAVIFLVWHQWGVGNIGTKSEGVSCSEFCQERGFAGSGMPPRNAGAPACICYDANGHEAVKVPIGDVTTGQR
jgi:hypothetical protein